MTYFFDNMVSVKKAVEENIERLSSNTDENGKIVLLDFNGNPTNNNTMLGNRLEIFNQFKKLLASYNLVTSEPSVEDFYHKNNWVLTEESAKYRRLVDGFYDRFDNVYERLGEIKEFQDKQASANQNDVTYRRTLQNSAKRVLGELWRVKRTLDIYYHEACKCANRSRLMCMIIGFVKLGEGFWNDPDSFEDGYSECLRQMYEEYEAFYKKIIYNDSHELAEMIT